MSIFDSGMRVGVVVLAVLAVAGCKTVGPETRLKNMRQLCDRNGFSQKEFPRSHNVCVDYLIEDNEQNGYLPPGDYATLKAMTAGSL